MVWVRFLGSIVNDDVDVCDCAVIGDVANFIVRKDVDCIGARGAGEVIALGQVSKFFTECSLPDVAKVFVAYEGSVFVDGHTGDRVYDGCAEVCGGHVWWRCEHRNGRMAVPPRLDEGQLR